MLDIINKKHGRGVYYQIKGEDFNKYSCLAGEGTAEYYDLKKQKSLPYGMLRLNGDGLYTPPPSNYKRLPTYCFMVQRGCPYKCAYCDRRIHGGKVRHADIETIIADMKSLKKWHGMKGVIFQDSCLTVNRKFSKRLFERMIDEKLELVWTGYTRADKVDKELLDLMKRSGCWSISFGIESANDYSLSAMRKGLTVRQNIEAVKMTKRAGIQVIGSFILCLPGEDEEMTLRTTRLAKALKLDIAVFFLPIPFPGTKLYEMCKDNLRENIQWSDYSQWMTQDDPLYINPKIGKERMVELYRYALKSFYGSPGYIMRSLSKIRTMTDVVKYYKGMRSLC